MLFSVMVDTRAARAGLLVLTLINLFNYLDRWIVAALAESMKHSELRLSDAQLGSLMTGFLIVYMLAAPLFGSLGDTRARPRMLALGVAIWSVATALAGFARGYASLFAARLASSPAWCETRRVCSSSRLPSLAKSHTAIPGPT